MLSILPICQVCDLRMMSTESLTRITVVSFGFAYSFFMSLTHYFFKALSYTLSTMPTEMLY
jgi:hypothetical protein